MQDCGIDWLSIHPRTKNEESLVPARWHIIRQIVEHESIKIPIYGSGDLFSPGDVLTFLKYTQASGVLLARGAIHYPQLIA